MGLKKSGGMSLNQNNSKQFQNQSNFAPQQIISQPQQKAAPVDPLVKMQQ